VATETGCDRRPWAPDQATRLGCSSASSRSATAPVHRTSRPRESRRPPWERRPSRPPSRPSLRQRRGVGQHLPVDPEDAFRHVGRRLLHIPERRQPAVGPQRLRRLGRSRDRVDPVPRLAGDDRMKCSPRCVPVLELRHLDLEPGVARELGHLASTSTPSTLQPTAWNWSGSPKWPVERSSPSSRRCPAGHERRAARSSAGLPATVGSLASGARGQPAQPLPAVCR
jgi:hypothetical protein